MGSRLTTINNLLRLQISHVQFKYKIMYNSDTRSVRQQSNLIRYLHNESLTRTEMSTVLQQIQGIL